MSRNTVKDRILKMKTSIADQLTKDISPFPFVLMRALMLHRQLDWPLLLDFVVVMKYAKAWLTW
jgi:hypothetical protein